MEGMVMIMESRRKLLKLICLSPIICSSIFYRRQLKAAEINREFVFIKGWILKKSDLPEDFINDY